MGFGFLGQQIRTAKFIGQRQIKNIEDAAYIIKLIIETINNILRGGVPILHLQTYETEPEYVDGATIVVADGTKWNPGSGAGLYYRTSGGAWTKIA